MDILLPLIFAALLLYGGIRLLARLFDNRDRQDLNQKFEEIVRHLKGEK